MYETRVSGYKKKTYNKSQTNFITKQNMYQVHRIMYENQTHNFNADNQQFHACR